MKNEIDNLREEMTKDAMANNKCLTREYLDKQNLDVLFNLTSPVYRERYNEMARKIKERQDEKLKDRLYANS